MRIVATALTVAVLWGTPSIHAHHSFAMFDRTREVSLEGVVKEFQWTNPHTWIQLLVTENGKTVEWSLEGGSPSVLSRNGWKLGSLKPGDKVKIVIYPLKNGQPGGSFLEVTKDDGTKLYYHG